MCNKDGDDGTDIPDNNVNEPTVDVIAEQMAKLSNWGAYENVKEEAVKRIEENRKGACEITVKLPNNQVAANSNVRVKLKRHAFKWGAVIQADDFAGSNTSPYVDLYKTNLAKYFNAAGFTIALKPKFRNTATERDAEDIMIWLRENNFYVRGHTLAWEGYNFLRQSDKDIIDDSSLSNAQKGELLLESVATHFTHALPKWDVDCWDVSNEPLANNVINDLLPDTDTHVHWFKLADQIRKQHGKDHVQLYQNDNRIISAITNNDVNNYSKPGYSSRGRPAVYREIIERQIAQGAPIEGIGFQSRIKNGLITPDVVYQRLQSFEKFNVPFHGTEFEIVDLDGYTYTDAERRLISEYMMVMYFSHPMMEGFWHWTFADRAPNSFRNFPYSLFRYNGTPNINGQIWIDLMEGFFDTELELTTDENGEISFSGYYGSYEVETEIDGQTAMATFELSNNTNCNQQIKLNTP